MQISIAVCDDEVNVLPFIQKSMQTIFDTTCFQPTYELFQSGKQLLNKIYEGITYDVTFLDIEMPEINGIDLGEQIRKKNKDTMIIFISAKENMVFDCFKAIPLSFVRKRQFKQDLGYALQKVISELEDRLQSRTLFIELQNEQHQIPIHKIIYIEADDKYLSIRIDQNTRLIRYRISEIEAKLENLGFIRIHKSYLVNYQYIYLIKNKSVILDDGTELPISRHRFDQVKQQFREYMQYGRI